MTVYEIIAQVIGVVAMAFNIFSYQQKSSRGAIFVQLGGAFLFCIHFLMLNAVVGGILNLIAVIRAIVYLNKDKLHTDHIGWLCGFIVIYIASYILAFTVFGKEFTAANALIELLPVVGMTAQTIAFRLNSAKAIRYFGLISSPAWLVYNIVNFALGAIICEALSIVSIITSVIRYDLKRAEKNMQ